jgi:uncharacterized membrane protein
MRRGIAAAVVFVVACAVIRGGLFHSERFGDVSLYASFAQRMLDGDVPYRDFFVEYPPGSLVSFLVPGVISIAHFTAAFKAFMALCGVATVLLVARIDRRPAVLIPIALAPLAVGPLLLDEFDLWPTLLTVAALLALLRGRGTVGAALLGLGAATKIFPAAILPVALVWLYRRYGRRSAARAAAAFAATVVVVYGVFAVVAPGGIWFSTRVQLQRGLQKESIGAAFLYVLDKLGLYTAHIRVGNAQWTELTGTAGTALTAISTIAEVAAVLLVVVLAARRAADESTLLLAATAAVAGFVAFGKVFSPQYLVWLVPLVPLAGGALEIGLLGAALVLTQLWFLRIVTPFDLDAGIWLVVLRDALVAGLFAACVLRLRARPATPRARGSAPEAPTSATRATAAP